jgi:hypothetical protein
MPLISSNRKLRQKVVEFELVPRPEQEGANRIINYVHPEAAQGGRYVELETVVEWATRRLLSWLLFEDCGNRDAMFGDCCTS